MSTPSTVYQYRAQYTFDLTVQIRHEINGYPDVSQAVKDGLAIMKHHTEEQFIKSMLESGHWFRMVNVQMEGGNGMPTAHTNWSGGMGVQDGWDVPINGKATVNFECDVRDMHAHGSPQLLAIVQQVITFLQAIWISNPVLFLVVVTVIVVVAVIGVVMALAYLANITTNVKDTLGTAGGQVAMAAVGIALLLGGVVALVVYWPRGKRKTKKRS